MPGFTDTSPEVIRAEEDVPLLSADQQMRGWAYKSSGETKLKGSGRQVTIGVTITVVERIKAMWPLFLHPSGYSVGTLTRVNSGQAPLRHYLGASGAIRSEFRWLGATSGTVEGISSPRHVKRPTCGPMSPHRTHQFDT